MSAKRRFLDFILGISAPFLPPEDQWLSERRMAIWRRYKLAMAAARLAWAACVLSLLSCAIPLGVYLSHEIDREKGRYPYSQYGSRPQVLVSVFGMKIEGHNATWVRLIIICLAAAVLLVCVAFSAHRYARKLRQLR